MSPLARVTDRARLRDLVEAVLAIGSDLSLPRVLQAIVENAARLLDAEYAALGVLSPRGDGLSEFAYVGMGAEHAARIGSRPQGRGVLGLLTADPHMLRLADLTRHPSSAGFPPGHPPMRSFLGTPILVRGEVYGALYVTDKRSGDEFSDDDELLAAGLARAAGMAIQNARLHTQLEEVRLAEDRERIAGDLHDTVIQRLFAIGLGLQSTVPRIDDPATARRVEQAIDDLDETIRQIRLAIFGLGAPRAAGRGVRGEVLSLVGEAAATLGFAPHVALDGPIETLVGDHVADHLLAVLREALANVARHAGARTVDVTVTLADGRLEATVDDDGRRVADEEEPAPPGQGLGKMDERARSLGGQLEAGPHPKGTGWRTRWTVPLAGA